MNLKLNLTIDGFVYGRIAREGALSWFEGARNLWSDRVEISMNEKTMRLDLPFLVPAKALGPFLLALVSKSFFRSSIVSKFL